MAPGRIRPARLQYMDLLLGRLREAGFSADATYSAYHVLDGYIFGFSLWEIAYTAQPPDPEALTALMATIPWAEYPHLTEHRDQHYSDGPHRDVSAFEVGLDLLLTGLAEKLRPDA
jgi:hypothetical protein